MNSDPLNNNKGTRTHPSLERLTRSFSEEERKFFVLWYSYWFLFFFFFHDRSTIVKTSIDCVFFLSIVVFSWTIGRCSLSPYPRGRTRGSISVFFRSRTWKIDDIPLSRRFPSAIQRIDCSRAARIDSIWTRLSKNFENRGMKTHNYMLSIVFFFSRTRPPALEIRQGMNQHPVFSLETEFIASRTSGFACVLSWIIGWSLNANTFFDSMVET